MADTQLKYKCEDLRQLAQSLLQAAGMDADKAAVVGQGLLEGDLLGATTHGLALCPDYVEELELGTMRPSGNPTVLKDFGAVSTWDGNYLPGVWLTREAVLEASGRAATHGIGMVTVRRSHHIACLGHYLLESVNRQEVLVIYSSDPSDSQVAPFGGVTPVLTPNPIAVGIPAEPYPMLIDFSTSITTAGACERSRREKRRLQGKWLLDSQGRPSDDPQIFGGDAGGTILPIGGLDHGHKGYGLSLAVEALTQGLSGFGRPQKPKTWGAAVTVQVLLPDAFGPAEDFIRQTSWLVKACLAARPRHDIDAVFVPGQRGLQRREKALKEGLTLYPGISSALADVADRYGLTMPEPLN